MIRRPPRSTRTDTPFPHTALFRSLGDPLDDGLAYDLTDPGVGALPRYGVRRAHECLGEIAKLRQVVQRHAEQPEKNGWGKRLCNLVQKIALSLARDRKSTRLNSSH